MKIANCRVGFVGFGHMAQIIMSAIQATKLIPHSQIHFHRRDPGKAKANEQEFGITATSLESLVAGSDLLLLCVRPNQADSVLRELALLGAGSKMLLSVMAGIKLSSLQKYFGAESRLVRIMPNIASEVREGMSLVSFGPKADIEFQSTVKLLFTSLGRIVEIPEEQMDIGTAMSGCGPGFVLELIEAMARHGEKEGMNYEKALEIAAQTFFGAALLVKEGGRPLDLLHRIATPGGVTQAGLTAMRSASGTSGLLSAVHAAYRRSKEISEEFT